MDMATAPTVTIVVPGEVLDDAASQINRVQRLLGILDDVFGEGLLVRIDLETDAAREVADQVEVLINVSREAADRAAGFIEMAYTDRLPRAKAEHETTVAKCRREWLTAIEAFRAADAVPMPEDADDEEFDRIAGPAVAALEAAIGTRVPDLRALHEKLSLIQSQDAWSQDGAIDHLFADIEALARAEIAAAKLEG